MVSDYSDAGQERWLADHGIALLRGSGRLAGTGVVEVDGVRHTAEHVVVATGADPIVPPVPGLRELDGVWGTREATSMKAVPRRLLVLGGGSAGVELAQVVRRLGGEAVIVEGSDRVLPREPAPLGDGARRGPARATASSWCSGEHATAARRDGDGVRPRVRRRPTSCAATGCSWRPADGRACTGSASRRSASSPTPHGLQVDEHLRAGERLWAIGDVTGIWPLTHVGEYEGDVVAENIAGDGVRPTTRPFRGSPTPTRRPRRSARPSDRYSATTPLSDVPKTATYTHAYAESNGFLTLLSDGERLTGAYALGPEAGEWLQQATLAIRAHVPLAVLSDTIQPFPSFSGIYDTAVKALRTEIATARRSRVEWQLSREEHDIEPARADASRAPRADRRADRRQRRHRARDRPPRAGRRGRRRPRRPRSRPARAGRGRRRTRAAPRPFDATDAPP